MYLVFMVSELVVDIRKPELIGVRMSVLQFLYEHAATGAMHDSDERYPPPLCYPGTREVMIVRIKDWYGFLTRPNKPIMWIHAPAGYGKTAVAGTISKWLEEVEGLDFSPLGATFYFWRTSPERNSPLRFIITIAYQLAESIPELAPHIDNAIKRSPMILRKALEVQLMKLIVEPFKALRGLDNMPNRLIIVDGLDECINSDQECRVERRYAEDQEKAQIRILELIHTLQSHRLPLSFLILSRPEAWIKQHIQSSPFERVVEVVDLYALGGHLKDTETYIRAELSRIAARVKDDGMVGPGEGEWPGEDVVNALIWRTNGHMQYASTAIRHIDNPYGDPRTLLKNLVESSSPTNPDLGHSSPFSSLNELYLQIMRFCPESNRALMIQVLEDIYHCFPVFSRTAGFQRALDSLDYLSGRVPGQGYRAIRPLHAVLNISRGGPDPYAPYPIALNPFIHSSFPEFLLNSRLSLEFAIDQQKRTRRILSGCLDCMSKITLESEMKGDAYLFAVMMWPDLVMNLLSSEPLNFPYVDVMEKLLSIDLVACSIKAITDGEGSLIYPLEYGSRYVDGLYHSFIQPFRNHRSFMSEPLAQRAVTHVVSSLENSVLHFLRRSPIGWGSNFAYAFVSFAAWFRGKGEGTWTIDNNHQVVKALRKLREEHLHHISYLIRFSDPFFDDVEEFLRAFDCHHEEPIDGDSPYSWKLCLDNT
jgi:hypothetical protein